MFGKISPSRQGGGGQKLNPLKRKSFGVIAIEVCFTLPVVVYLIFFTIELIKINITQDALQSICEEATYLTIAHDYENGPDLIAKIDAIVEKYRPVFIPEKAPGYTSTPYPVIRWCFETYPMFGEKNDIAVLGTVGDMLSHSPYGGSTITYPGYELGSSGAGKVHAASVYAVGQSQFIPASGKELPANPEYYDSTKKYMNGDGLPNNRVFVLTVACNYPFSNSLVKRLFNGGVNTKFVTANMSGTPSEAKPGTMYLLWARGAGIVNAK